MQEAVERRTPVHLWIVGVLSLLWNSFGAVDYTMTRLRNTEYLSSIPGITAEELLAYIDSYPVWAQIGWGLGVWGAFAGSILLLLRSRFAVPAFALSLIGAIMSLGYQWLGLPAPPALSEGAMAYIPVFIIIVAAALLYYTWRQRRNGVLR